MEKSVCPEGSETGALLPLPELQGLRSPGLPHAPTCQRDKGRGRVANGDAWRHASRGAPRRARLRASWGPLTGLRAGAEPEAGRGGQTTERAGPAPGPRRQHTERAPVPEGSDAGVPGRHSGRHRVSQEEGRGLRGVRGRRWCAAYTDGCKLGRWESDRSIFKRFCCC